MGAKSSTPAIIAIILWTLTALLPIVRAQRSDAGQPAASLTDDALEKMLDGLGYSPKKLSIGYLIVVKRDTWTFNVQLVLSKDRNKLGMNANLGEIPKIEDVAASQWLALLEANRDIDPSAFFVDKSNQKLYIHRTVDNRDITPAILRQEIDYFCTAIKVTQKTWEFTK